MRFVSGATSPWFCSEAIRWSDWELEGTIVLMDALYTQEETARSIVQEGGGDFVLVIKGNQETLHDKAQNHLAEEADATRLLDTAIGHGYWTRLLELVRRYWSIEDGTHYPLDVSAWEDQCRVGHPVSVTVFGIQRRAVQGEYRAWARSQSCKRDRTFPTFRDKMSRRLNQAIRLAAGLPSRV